MPMIQDIAPHRFDNAFSHDAPRPQDAVFAFQGRTLLAAVAEERLILPTFADLPGAANRAQYLFRIDERAYFRYEGEPLPEAAPFQYTPLGALRDLQPLHEVFACAAAETLDRWYGNNRFCGRCGAENRKSDVEPPWCARSAARSPIR